MRRRFLQLLLLDVGAPVVYEEVPSCFPGLEIRVLVVPHVDGRVDGGGRRKSICEALLVCGAVRCVGVGEESVRLEGLWELMDGPAKELEREEGE